MFKDISLNTLAIIAIIKLMINGFHNYIKEYLDISFLFILLFIILFIIYIYIYKRKEFYNNIRKSIVYKLLIDFIFLVIIFVVYMLFPRFFTELCHYFSPSLLGIFYLFNMSFINNIYFNCLNIDYKIPVYKNYDFKYFFNR